MNKKTKAIASAILGASLLTGASGTFALWFDTARVTSDNVVTGDLYLSAGSFNWVYTIKANAGPVTTNNAFTPGTGTGSQRIVPGDKVQGTATVNNFVLTGDTLTAKLEINGLPATANAPLVTSLQIGNQTATVTNGVATFTGLTPANYRTMLGFTDGVNTLPVVVTVGLPKASQAVATGGLNNGHGRVQTVTLNSVNVTLTQTTAENAYAG